MVTQFQYDDIIFGDTVEAETNNSEKNTIQTEKQIILGSFYDIFKSYKQ